MGNIKMISKIMEWYRRYCFYEYGWIRQYTKNKRTRQIVLLCLTPILLPLILLHIIYERTIGLFYVRYLELIEAGQEFEHELSVVAIAKNETLYIREWIEYNRLIGVTKFYIYDNGSTDDLKQCLLSYIEDGCVEYKYYPGRAMQLSAYNDALCKCRKNSKYVAFIDIDEFMASSDQSILITEAVESIIQKKKHVAGVAINWYTYGTSGHKTKPEGLVIENYLYHGNDDAIANRCIKTICNPRLLLGFVYNPHNPVCRYGTYVVTEKGKRLDGPWNPYPNNSYDVLRINHYYCKSEEEARIKFERGRADFEEDIKYKWEQFYQFDRNEVYDPILLPYSEEIHKRIDNA